MEKLELVKFGFICITTFCSLCTFILLLRSKRISFSTKSGLRMINGKYQAVITVINRGEKSIVVNSVRFPIIMWDNEPRLPVPRLLKLFRLLDDLTSNQPLSVYASDKVVTYDRERSKALATGESITAYIPLDDMMDVFFDSGEFLLGSRLSIFLYLSFMQIQVATSLGKISKKLAKWDIRYYLVSNYGTDERLTNARNAL
ncbi:hypothetical protein AWQ14_06695 [Vibrio parahaemolyticus]|uniref:hypothetical protein n=3 Tax=Vibrio parahaemolyticus TaxID=670 RepID=UPI00035920DA|nr:hypothetical protein [Vibrio parahaemolyticus]AGQ99993.1 hypothetical protein M636_12645 [Vibrio parahaemolyticus O1:K33 str. CDC_K4557]EGQ7895839.1 hypothetical protein [Vibrio parahaemolyticus]EGQ8481348.1 hypothetical protein [Vibrio parahaemolyticus]EGQ9152861.1 hypothetical protein [Vibrio parahaemolyticus]EGQ9886917.1 hypothetical protein [Vibrio parahaemolyticus]